MSDRPPLPTITLKLGAVELTVAPHELAEMMSDEDKMRIAEALCWREVMQHACLRLAGESDFWDGGYADEYGDHRTRLAFLDKVGAAAHHAQKHENELLARQVAELKQQRDRTLDRLGLGSDVAEIHSRAWSIVYDNDADYQARSRRAV